MSEVGHHFKGDKVLCYHGPLLYEAKVELGDPSICVTLSNRRFSKFGTRGGIEQ